MKFDDAPRLPKLPFIVGDVALLALASLIAALNSNPAAPLPLFVITGCVVAGIVVSMIPFLVNYARDREDAATAQRHELDEHLKQLMAASDHLQNSTIQLKSVEETATKNVEAAERLPYRLQERIAEFNQQIAAAENKDKARLEQELARLRSGESERLTAAADQIAKALAEWTRLEADARRSLTDTAQREKELFEQQVADLRATESERLAAAAGEVTKALAGWAGIETNVRLQLAAAARLQEKFADALSAIDGRIAGLQAAVEAAAKAADGLSSASPPPAIVLPPPAPAGDSPITAGPESVESMAAAPLPVVVEPVSAPEPVVLPDWQAILEPAPADFAPSGAAELPPATAPEPSTTAGSAPAFSEVSPAVDPIAAVSEPIPPPALPDATSSADSPATDLDEPELPASSPDTPDLVASSKPRKPRAPRKPRTESAASADSAAEPAAGSPPAPESPIASPPPVELIAEPVVDEPPTPEDFSQVPPEENKPVATPSPDGRTRLTVISYIGIGNKLHLRGEGAGLSPTKGVPLQFVSIGRWRWETDAASGPVVCRIYKNDKLEAPGGALTLLPGTEQEVSASF